VPCWKRSRTTCQFWLRRCDPPGRRPHAVATRVRHGLAKVAPRELSAGAGLQVAFELQGGCLFVEFDDHEQPPRPVLRRVFREAGIVCLQPRGKVRRRADVVLIVTVDALDDIDEPRVTSHDITGARRGPSPANQILAESRLLECGTRRFLPQRKRSYSAESAAFARITSGGE